MSDAPIKATDEPEDIHPDEFDFRSGVRGKYAQRYAERTSLVVLDPDVAEAFPTSEDVNRALRKLLGRD